MRGEPVFLQAGDTLSGVSVVAKVNNASGTTTARFGRVMVRIMSYDEWRALQSIESQGNYILPAPTETVRGGIMAKVKTTETSEVAYDPVTQKLYAAAAPAGQAAWSSLTGSYTDNAAFKSIIDGLRSDVGAFGDALDAISGDSLGDVIATLDSLNGEVI